MRIYSGSAINEQAGVVLIAALVILIVLTLLGIATMDMTGVEMKMANNAGDQQMAFESAEYILTAVENDFIQKFPLDTEIASSCSGNKCFNANCDNGYCFFGANPSQWNACTPTTSAASVTNPWENAAYWSGATKKSITLQQPTNSSLKVEYLVEFRCYVPKDPTIVIGSGNATKLFRITAYVIGAGNKGRVMLQSTVKQL